LLLKPNKTTWIYISLGLLSLILAFSFWHQAFPTAALDFKMGRTEGSNRMAAWIESQGFSLRNYRSVVDFDENDETKNFIELERGLPFLERSVRNGVHIWSWYGRWFKPKQTEEFTAAIDLQGHIVGFDHTIEEKRAAPRLTEEAARTMAENFLKTQIVQHPFKKLRFIESSLDEKPNRMDYEFEWEREGLQIAGAEYRLRVSIQGDQIGGYTEYLKIPETWSRQFERKRETNTFLKDLARYVSAPLYISVAILLIIYLYRHQLDFRCFPKRWIFLYAAVNLLDEINDIPSFIFTYQTDDRWGGFILRLISDSLRDALAPTVLLWLLVVVANSLYQNSLKDRLPFRFLLGSGALQYRETLRSIGLGIVFACVSFGYVSVFYAVGKPLGIWSPIEIDYSQTLTGWFPWINSMQVGMTAALHEEMIFRVIAILLYTKLFRSRRVAIVLAALNWAFLHSDYPQMPAYTRGLELTFAGILWGVLMVRYGILTTLVAHYLYDCWVGSLIVVQSADWTNRVGAVAVSLWPIAIGVYGWMKYARKGKLIDAPSSEESNSTFTFSAFHWWESPAHAWKDVVIPLTKKGRWIASILSAVLFGLAYFLPVPSDLIDDHLGQIDLNAQQILQKSNKLLKSQGKDPSQYHSIIALHNNEFLETDYFFENGGDLESFVQFCEKERPEMLWNIKYFRFLEKEEFLFQFDKYGNLYSWNHTVPREAEGASLEKDIALDLAKEKLEEFRHIDFSKEKLVEDDVEKQTHRTDYAFSFERLNWKLGESQLRTGVIVQGNEVMNFSHYIKIPEEWFREETAEGWKDSIMDVFSSWFTIVWFCIFIVLMVMMILKNLIPWRIGFGVAFIPIIFGWVDGLNRLPWFFSEYTTVTPALYYVASQIGQGIVENIKTYLEEVLKLSVTLGLLYWAFGWKIDHLSLWPKNLNERKTLWLDAFILSFLGIAIVDSFNFLQSLVSGLYFPSRVASVSFPSINHVIPWLSSVTSAFEGGYNQLLTIASLVAGSVILYRKFPKTVCVVFILSPLVDVIQESKTWHEFTVFGFFRELHWIIYFYLIWRVWRFNALAIFLATASNKLLASIDLFRIHGGLSYQWQAIPLLFLFLAPLLIAWISSVSKMNRAATQKVKSNNGAV
jgi:hypothetical protein